MVEKLKVKFLTVIWGARYIEEFARVSLPSYMAAGNLPFVASATDLEIVILTSTESQDKFDEQPIFRKLKALCPVRFIFIDDLITTGVYGVTLTLAYARGILDSGSEQTNTHFVFMNSDFVLADGSLKTLIAKLREGHRCIMAPSLRVRSETTIPALIGAVDQADHILAMPPRRMVQLAFDNLHPTVIGKTITQNFITCENHNQIYWQVDETTLLGRYHLIFMLAIKPEVPMGPVNSYCDYGFVPELVPSLQFTIIDDSVDFFMLELQPDAQEKNLLRCGTSTSGEIAGELSMWTTREHLRFAEVDVIFRTSDLPARLADVRSEATRFTTELHRSMKNLFKTHVDHFYWVSGLQAWSSRKFPSETPKLPPELTRRVEANVLGVDSAAGGSPTPGLWRTLRRYVRLGVVLNLLRYLRQLVARSYMNFLGFLRRLIGAIPNVPIWHHLWLDSRLLLNWIKDTKADQHGRNLLVCDESSPLPISLRKRMLFDVHVGFSDLLTNVAEQAQGNGVAPEEPANQFSQEPYDNVLVHVYRADVLKSRKILERTERFVKPDGTIAIYIDHRDAELDNSNFSLELARYVEEILPANWIRYHLKTGFVGGRTLRRLRLTERFLFRYLNPSSADRLPYLIAAVPLWPIVAALMALTNYRLRNASSICPEYCRSALLSMTRLSWTGANKSSS